MAPTSSPVIAPVEPEAPHDEAAFNVRGRFLLSSFESARDFCKAMLKVSLSAVPVYVGFLKLFLPDEDSLTEEAGIAWVIPVAFFLLAALISVLGSLPARRLLSMDAPEEIERALRNATTRLYGCGLAAFVLIALGIAYSMVVLWIT